MWLAHRHDGRFEGRVAIKLLNMALVGRAGEERFRQEGHLLARLTHPNIARLLDAGVTDHGQPYLALEYVDGVPIDQYADRVRLGAEDRIRLVIDVMTAIGSAHSNLIIHRDIKPSNILVTAEGTVKLLDFGIAKLLAEGRMTAEASTLTDAGGRAFTPGYAAPEVVLGDPVSTATDVYMAGVLLFELLTGRHPTGAPALTPSAAIMASVGREPARLSTAAQTDSPGGPEQLAAGRAALRGSTPARLARRYRGDLDNILDRALRKDPTERYQTAAAFADDLGRSLRYEAVSAGGEGLGYRMAKFARRHRTAVTAAGLVALSLVGGAGAAVRQMRIAEGERDRAESARLRAEASVAFESLVFRLLDPNGPPMTYRQLLETGRRVLEKEFRGLPEARMQLGIQFAQNYLRGNDPAAARAVVQRTVAIADSVGDLEWRARTRCAMADPLVKLGHADSAIGFIADARPLLARVPTPERATLNICDYGEAEARLARGEAEPAIALYQAYNRRLEQAGDTTLSDYVVSLNNLARALNRSGRQRDAMVIVLRLIEMARAGAVRDPETLAVLIFNAAVTFDALGEYQARRTFLAREITRSSGVEPPADPALLYDYGLTLDRLGEPDSAVVWLERVVADSRTDSARVFSSHLLMSRLRGGSRHRQAAVALLPIASRMPSARATLAVHRIREAGLQAGPVRLGEVIDSELDSLGFKGDGKAHRWVAPLLEASRALLAHGLGKEALAYALHAVRIGSRDSLALTQSAIVGEGLWLAAQARLILGDTAAARQDLAKAKAPLAAGLGVSHPVARAASMLAERLGPR